MAGCRPPVSPSRRSRRSGGVGAADVAV